MFGCKNPGWWISSHMFSVSCLNLTSLIRSAGKSHSEPSSAVVVVAAGGHRRPSSLDPSEVSSDLWSENGRQSVWHERLQFLFWRFCLMWIFDSSCGERFLFSIFWRFMDQTFNQDNDAQIKRWRKRSGRIWSVCFYPSTPTCSTDLCNVRTTLTGRDAGQNVISRKNYKDEIWYSNWIFLLFFSAMRSFWFWSLQISSTVFCTFRGL